MNYSCALCVCMCSILHSQLEGQLTLSKEKDGEKGAAASDRLASAP